MNKDLEQEINNKIKRKITRVVKIFLLVFISASVVTLVALYFSGTLRFAITKDGIYKFYKFEDGLMIEGYVGKKEELVIPESILRTQVTTIRSLDNSCIKSLTVPESVIIIYTNALEDCSSIEKITLPLVKDFGYDEWADREYPIGRYFGSDEERMIKQYYSDWSHRSYGLPSSLKSVSIIGGEESIPSYYFSNCKGLKEITISARIKTIGNYAFYGCDELESINYLGTISQWQSVQRQNWHGDDSSPKILVRCSDGEVIE